MTADCKSDSVLSTQYSVPIPPRIYSRFIEYRLFKYSRRELGYWLVMVVPVVKVVVVVVLVLVAEGGFVV